jgi:guanosine-3',5'-bis(diphosphate) 3'-pyrophosphohydrolase
MHAVAEILKALRFAAIKHRDHRRKDPDASPYINHPIEVAELLVRLGELAERELLQAAILHDSLEDTDTTAEEIENEFGPTVRSLVEAVTDDKSLPKQERKRLQIENASSLSTRAKQIKLADKICNVRDVTHAPPAGWSLERRAEYIAWSRSVVAGCRGVNPPLEREFDAVCAEAETELKAQRDASSDATGSQA